MTFPYDYVCRKDTERVREVTITDLVRHALAPGLARFIIYLRKLTFFLLQFFPVWGIMY